MPVMLVMPMSTRVGIRICMGRTEGPNSEPEINRVMGSAKIIKKALTGMARIIISSEAQPTVVIKRSSFPLSR